MKTTEATRKMLFGLWNQARQILRARGFSPAEADAERAALTLRTLGEPRSWKALSDDDVDEIKGALLALTEPTDLDAQVGQLNGARRRRWYVLDRLLARLGGKPREYAEGIVQRMHREGRVDKDNLGEVNDEGFDAVIVALRAQVRRAKGDAPRWENKTQRARREAGEAEAGEVAADNIPF